MNNKYIKYLHKNNILQKGGIPRFTNCILGMPVEDEFYDAETKQIIFHDFDQKTDFYKILRYYLILDNLITLSNQF